MSMSIKFLVGLCRWIDKLNTWVGWVVAWVPLGLVLVVFTDVVMRYLFRTSFVFTQELEWHLFAFIFLIGGGYTLLHDGHVRVDIIYQKLGFKARAWANLLGVLLLLIPGCLLIIITSLNFVYRSSKSAMVACKAISVSLGYRTRSPACRGLANSATTTWAPSGPAARIMPWLTPKRMVRGFRLATTMTCLPTRSHGA